MFDSQLKQINASVLNAPKKPQSNQVKPWNISVGINAALWVLGLIICMIVFYVGVQSIKGVMSIPLEKVMIRGDLEYVSKKQVQDIINQTAMNGFVGIDLADLQASLTQLPWVKTVTLKRQIPNSLMIHIEEESIVASWNNQGVMTDQGSVIQSKDQYDHLPAFWGKEPKLIAHYYNDFIGATEKIFLPVTKLNVSESGIVSFTLQNHLKVIFSQNAFQEQLNRWKKIIVRPELNGQINQMEAIDLRYSNGFAVTFRQAKDKNTSLRRVN